MRDGNLDDDELHCVREWLKTKDKREYCPFDDLDYEYGHHCNVICPSIFPGLTHKPKYNDKGDRLCPCDRYGMSYVVRKARILLARHGRLRRERKES